VLPAEIGCLTRERVDALLRVQAHGPLGSAVVSQVELAVPGDPVGGQQRRNHRPLRHATHHRNVDPHDPPREHGPQCTAFSRTD